MDVSAAGKRGAAGDALAPKSKDLDPDDAFWIEVALAFGGRTPEEWQEALTPEWRDKLSLYRERYGPFNAPLRIERMLATVAAPFLGKNVKAADLLTWPKEPEPEATIEGAFALFAGLASKTHRKP